MGLSDYMIQCLLDTVTKVHYGFWTVWCQRFEVWKIEENLSDTILKSTNYREIYGNLKTVKKFFFLKNIFSDCAIVKIFILSNSSNFWKWKKNWRKIYFCFFLNIFLFLNNFVIFLRKITNFLIFLEFYFIVRIVISSKK